MTTSMLWDFNCPNCATVFQSQLFASTNTLGPIHTDFRRRAVGGQPTRFRVHMCYGCGFSGNLDAFEGTVTPDISDLIKERLIPLSEDDQKRKPWVKFQYAAQIAIWNGSTFEQIADLFQSAAHICQDQENESQEREYRASAADFLTMAVQKEEYDLASLAQATYLIGELYRRAGDGPKSDEWLRNAERLARPVPNLQWIFELAVQQRLNPREFVDRQALGTSE